MRFLFHKSYKYNRVTREKKTIKYDFFKLYCIFMYKNVLYIRKEIKNLWLHGLM